MIQVFRQTENKPSSVFNTISNGKKEEHIFLKEPMMDKKKREGEEK